MASKALIGQLVERNGEWDTLENVGRDPTLALHTISPTTSHPLPPLIPQSNDSPCNICAYRK